MAQGQPEELLTNLFTPPRPKKRSWEEIWVQYRERRDKVISELFYNGQPIIDKKP